MQYFFYTNNYSLFFFFFYFIILSLITDSLFRSFLVSSFQSSMLLQTNPLTTAIHIVDACLDRRNHGPFVPHALLICASPQIHDDTLALMDIAADQQTHKSGYNGVSTGINRGNQLTKFIEWLSGAIESFTFSESYASATSATITSLSKYPEKPCTIPSICTFSTTC